MLQWIQNWWRGRGRLASTASHSALSTPHEQYPTRPFSSMPNPSMGGVRFNDDGIISPPAGDPQALFSLLRWMRDHIPDVSAGVWAWVRLCNTPQTYSFIETSGQQSIERAHAILAALDRRIFGAAGEKERGVASLIQAYFLSIFTYGSFCGEVIVNPAGNRIERFIVIDPATIRFRLDPHTRQPIPGQLQADGEWTPLNPASFFYDGIDTDGLSPYGRSPLMAAPFVAHIQQQLLIDMAHTQRNAGYATLHVRITPPAREPGESQAAYHQRLHHDINHMRDQLSVKKPNDNLITHDNVEVNYVGPNGRQLQWSESLNAISEQVISALHLAPFMIGRNWGTTQSWGTAQYQLITNNARTVQEGARRLAGWLRNLELTLQGSPLRVTHHFAPHHHIDIAERAQAFERLAHTYLSLNQAGQLDPDSLQTRLAELQRLIE